MLIKTVVQISSKEVRYNKVSKGEYNYLVGTCVTSELDTKGEVPTCKYMPITFKAFGKVCEDLMQQLVPNAYFSFEGDYSVFESTHYEYREVESEHFNTLLKNEIGNYVNTFSDDFKIVNGKVLIKVAVPYFTHQLIIRKFCRLGLSAVDLPSTDNNEKTISSKSSNNKTSSKWESLFSSNQSTENSYSNSQNTNSDADFGFVLEDDCNNDDNCPF